jgi:hypothetical protein
MPFEKVIPIELQDGNKFLLRISEFENDFGFEIPIVDVQFVMIERDENKPAIYELIYIAKELISFLKKNDVVLYYYCDNILTHRSKRNLQRLPQAYRYLLFDRLFERFNDGSLIKDDVIIEENGGHYISLISSIKNKKTLTHISTEIEKINDK